MTQRPHLSDRVVFTVTAPRPEFWRGETFDVWNGHQWTQSGPPASVGPARRRHGRIHPEVDDVGAFTGPPMQQTFHLESGFSDVIFAAPSPVSVETDRLVAERNDGTASVVTGFGKGATYTVTSRSVLSTESSCVPPTHGRCPPRCAASSRRRPITTQRVRLLAREDHRGRAHHLRQDPRRSSGGSARTFATRSTLRSHRRESTSSTISCSVRASAGVSRLRAASW